VGFRFGAIALMAGTDVGIEGKTGVEQVEVRSIGCVIIGPVVDLPLRIMSNAAAEQFLRSCTH
jgi:hypothetical protein